MDAREVLGVSKDAGEEEIRAAYLCKVKQYPPEQAPEEFEKVRNAFAILGDPRKRALAMLEDSGRGTPLVSLLDGIRPRRLFAGPQAWRQALQRK
jgi:DnaJ domain